MNIAPLYNLGSKRFLNFFSLDTLRIAPPRGGHFEAYLRTELRAGTFGNYTILDHILNDAWKHFSTRPVDFLVFRMDPNDFEVKTHEIFGLPSKVLLGRGPKRSGAENQCFSQSGIERD